MYWSQNHSFFRTRKVMLMALRTFSLKQIQLAFSGDSGKQNHPYPPLESQEISLKEIKNYPLILPGWSWPINSTAASNGRHCQETEKYDCSIRLRHKGCRCLQDMRKGQKTAFWKQHSEKHPSWSIILYCKNNFFSEVLPASAHLSKMYSYC